MKKPLIRCHVDPTLLQHARIWAEEQGISLSRFFENAVQQAVSKASMDCATRDAEARVRAETHLP